MTGQIQKKRLRFEELLASIGMLEEWTLVVMNDKEGLREVCSLLDAEGCQIDMASTGGEAIEKMTRRSYILNLMDASLPDMSGVDLLVKANSLNPESVKIMLLGEDDLEAGINAIMAGADHIIQKPVDPEKFLRVVEGKLKAMSGAKPSTMKDEVTVVLPVLNEEEAIDGVLKELSAQGYENVLVVDGYSTDRTVDIAREAGARVVTQHGRGKSGAIKTSFRHVETPYLLVMDGDQTYSAGDIERFLPFAEEFDQIFGFRMNRDHISRLHRFGNRVINTALRILVGAHISDVCTGMYMMKTEVARRLELKSRGFDVEVEAAIQNVTNGKVTEVPITYRKRIGEKKLTTWRQGFKILWTVIRLSFSHNPVFFLSALGALFGLPGAFLLLGELYMKLLYGEAGRSIDNVWLGLVLFFAGLNFFTVSVLTLISKRQERHIIEQIKSMKK